MSGAGRMIRPEPDRDDGIAFFRGLLMALPIAAAFWLCMAWLVGII